MNRLGRRLLTLCSAVSIRWPLLGASRPSEGVLLIGWLEYRWPACEGFQVWPPGLAVGSSHASYQPPAMKFSQRRVVAEPDGFGGHRVLVPIWMPAVVTSFTPGVSLWRVWSRGRRRPGGLCMNCGYDLRATPARCPECGAVPELIA